jgi:hypothetical protein
MSDDRAHDLAQFANADAQPNQPTPGGHAIARQTTGLVERVFGAQPVAKERNEVKIRQKLKALAAYAGEDWFYRFPVKKAGGGQDYISGPSIKLANNVAREFGNNIIEIREIDVGDAWTFYARFTDIETGFSMERAYRQRKGQASMRTRDAERSLDIAYSIGQSKAIRNVIVNALGIYCDFAFEEAENSLVEKIGKDLAGWRERTIKGLARLAIAPERVERVIGRSAKDWLAPDVAQVVAMCKSIVDGMANADEVFPPLDSPPPSSGDTPEAVGEGGAQGAAPTAADESAARTTSATDSNRPAAADISNDELAQAYKLGTAAKAQGHGRKAIPGEYRDATHQRQAICWIAGFEGKPMPEFKDQS